ncbi:MAG: hypothetical protein ACOC2C_05945 [Cyclonatronaceae bacterium]
MMLFSFRVMCALLLAGFLGLCLAERPVHAQQHPQIEEQQRLAEAFIRPEWQASGVRQDFPTPETAARVFRLSAQHPGRDCDQHFNTENRAPDLQHRIDEAGAFAREHDGPTLVLLGPGCFRLEDPVGLRSGRHDRVYIRGHSAPDWAGYSPETETRLELHFRLDARKFTMGQLAAFTFYGYDAQSIPIRDVSLPGRLRPETTHNLSAGDMVLLSNVRDERPLMFGEMNFIADPPPQMMETQRERGNALSTLMMAYPADLSLRRAAESNSRMQLTPITPLREAGIGFLRLESADTDPDGTQLHHIIISQAVDIQVREIVSRNTPSRHITLYRALHTGIYDNFFDGTQYVVFGRVGAGYGVHTDRKSTLSRIENNAFQGLRAAVSLSRGGNRNVIAYNYSRAPRTPGDMRSRNRQDAGNLFEGNILSAFHADTYHISEEVGQSYFGMENVLLRNRMTDRSGNPVDLRAGSFTLLGNNADPEASRVAGEVELRGFFALYPNGRPAPPLRIPGLSETRQTDHEPPRLSRAAAPPPETAYLPYKSFYLDDAPAFYTSPSFANAGQLQQLPWPSIGPPVETTMQNLPQHNPAYLRYCRAFPDDC